MTLGIAYFRNTEKLTTPNIYEHAVHPLNDGTNNIRICVDFDYAVDQTRRITMGIDVTMVDQSYGALSIRKRLWLLLSVKLKLMQQ